MLVMYHFVWLFVIGLLTRHVTMQVSVVLYLYCYQNKGWIQHHPKINIEANKINK